MKRLTYLLLSCACITACSSGTPSLGWREATLSESTKTYRISGAYPVIVGLPDDDQSDVNTKIKQLVEETMSDFRRTAAAIPQAKLKGNISALTITYERATLTSDLVSFALNIESSIAGAANPNSYVRTFNFDLKKLQSLSVEGVLARADSGLQELSEKARSALTEAAKVRGTYDDNTAALIEVGTAPESANFNAFLMESGSLILLFSPYQVAPGSEGTQRISIEINTLQ